MHSIAICYKEVNLILGTSYHNFKYNENSREYSSLNYIIQSYRSQSKCFYRKRYVEKVQKDDN